MEPWVSVCMYFVIWCVGCSGNELNLNLWKLRQSNNEFREQSVFQHQDELGIRTNDLTVSNLPNFKEKDNYFIQNADRNNLQSKLYKRRLPRSATSSGGGSTSSSDTQTFDNVVPVNDRNVGNGTTLPSEEYSLSSKLTDTVMETEGSGSATVSVTIQATENNNTVAETSYPNVLTNSTRLDDNTSELKSTSAPFPESEPTTGSTTKLPVTEDSSASKMGNATSHQSSTIVTEPVVEPEPTAESEPTSEPETTAEPRVDPESTVEQTAEPESTAEPTAELESNIELTAEPESTIKPTAEPDSTAEPIVDPESTAEPTVEPETTVEATTEPESSVEPTTEPEFTAELTAVPESTVEPTAEPESTAEPTTEPESTAELTAVSESTVEPTAEPESTAEPTVEPESTAEPTAKPESTAGPTAEPESTAEPTTEPESTAEPTTEPESSAEPTAEPESTSEPTVEPESTVEPTAEPESTVEPTAEPESTAEPTAEPESTAEPTAEPESTAEPTAEPKYTAEPTSEPESSAEPTSEPESSAEPTTEPESTAEPTTEPESTAEPTTEPESTAEPIAESDSTAEPAVEPESTSEPETSNEPAPETNSTSEPNPDPEGEPEAELGGNAFSEPQPEWSIAMDIWQWGWDVLIYFFGALFLLLAAISMLSLIRLWKTKHLLSKNYFMVLNILIICKCLLRSAYLFVDAYNLNNTFHAVLAYFLYSTAFPCLTAAFSILFYALLLATKMRVISARIQKLSVLIGIIVFHFVLSITTDIVVGLFSDAKVMLLVCQFFYILWGMVLFLGYFYLYKKLHESAVHRQQAMIKHSSIDSAEKAKKPKKSKYMLTSAIKVTLIVAVSGVICVFVELYGIFGVYRLFVEGHTPAPWPWYIYQLLLRVTEIIMCSTMVYIGSQPVKYRKKKNSGLCYEFCLPFVRVFCCSNSDSFSDSDNLTSQLSSNHALSNTDDNSSSKGKYVKKSNSGKKSKSVMYEKNGNGPQPCRHTHIVIEDGLVRFKSEDELTDGGSERAMSLPDLLNGSVVRGVPELDKGDNSGVLNEGFNSSGVVSFGSIKLPRNSTQQSNLLYKSMASIGTTGTDFNIRLSSMNLASSLEWEFEQAYDRSFHQDDNGSVKSMPNNISILTSHEPPADKYLLSDISPSHNSDASDSNHISFINSSGTSESCASGPVSPSRRPLIKNRQSSEDTDASKSSKNAVTGV